MPSWANDVLRLVPVAIILLNLYLKRHPNWLTLYRSKMLPLFTFAVILFRDILLGIGADLPGTQVSSYTVVQYLALEPWLPKDILARALIEAMLITGIHSWPKNVWQGIVDIARNGLLPKAPSKRK